MSNAALTWAFSVDGVTPAEKLVLLALADQANGDDRCWPQQAETAKRCCLRPESVNRAIKSLAAKQLIDIEGTGQRRRYRLRMTSDHTENSMTTDHSQYDATSISDCAQVIPSMTTDQSPIDNPNKPSLTQKNPERAARARAARLPGDWWPTPAGEQYALKLGLDPPAVAEAFRDHWHAAGGPTSLKLDWDAAFRTWCRHEVGRFAAGKRRQTQGEAHDAETRAFEFVTRPPGYRCDDSEVLAALLEPNRTARREQALDGGGLGGRPRRLLA